jgi:methionyl-tRNA formyltransferase
MINGESKTGVSLFYLEKGVDEGDIIAQQTFLIEPDDTISDVLIKAEKASINIIKEHVPRMLNGTSSRLPQNHQEATYFPRRTPKDGEIDWNLDDEKINCFIKAQTHPYPGAFTVIGNKKVIIWEATVTNINT